MEACGESLWRIHAGLGNQEGSWFLVGIQKDDMIRCAGVVRQPGRASGQGWESVAVPDTGGCQGLESKSTDQAMTQWELGSQ